MLKSILSFIVFILAVQLSAQDISKNLNSPSETFGQLPLSDRGVLATTITHSVDPTTVTTGTGVSCTASGITSDNQYWRSFILADFGITNDFAVTMVEFGIEQATAGVGGVQPMTVNLYTTDLVFPTGTLTLIGTADVMVPDQALSLFQIPVTGTAPAGSELVVEISIPADTGDGNTFYPGANSLGESAPSYISSAGCGITTPTTYASIGFVTCQLVMSVTGDEAASSDLFFSEYLEGSSNNKALEIYNPTNAPVDLSNYRVVRANNGSLVIQDSLLMVGTLAPNQVYVIANPSSDPIILAVADVDTGTITFYNGDDYMALEKNIASVWTQIDVIGVLGVDPGTAWPVAGVSNATGEHTLVRKDFIMMGNTDWAASAGTDSISSEWLVYPQNTFIYLGNHTIIPVELTSFAASVNGTSVNLNWSTATELNNSGFDIERKSSSSSWTKIGFVAGHGTTSEAKNYSYSDNNLGTGNYSYRLKQVDFDGTYEYSKAVEVEIVTPNNFELSQNYPNPFNPTTSIKFNMPEAGNVKLAVYNLLGQEVKTLVNGFRTAGAYTVNFDASNLSSGIYLYKIEMNNFTQVRKMTLLK